MRIWGLDDGLALLSRPGTKGVFETPPNDLCVRNLVHIYITDSEVNATSVSQALPRAWVIWERRPEFTSDNGGFANASGFPQRVRGRAMIQSSLAFTAGTYIFTKGGSKTRDLNEGRELV